MDEHTKGKHQVLEGYLKAWLPILGQTQARIAFIDAFAGPGRYTGGERGSPLIALDVIRSHPALSRLGEVNLLFVEADEDRCAYLQQEIEPYRSRLPERIKFEAKHGKFDETLTTLLDDIEGAKRGLVPCLMMVDPFGVSDTPLSVIRRFLQHGQSETLVTFMVDFIDRFDEGKEFPPHLDALFGTEEWREAAALEKKDDRREYLFELYRRQLKAAGATQVVRFDLWDGGRLVYALFHASKHCRACDRMKESIWKADPSGEFSFRASRKGQLGLLLGPSFDALVDALVARFVGKGPIRMSEILDFVASDETDYYTGKLRKEALAPMEKAGRLRVHVEGKRTGMTYPEERTSIEFLR